MNSVIIIVAALLPVILLWLYIWKKDPQKEPTLWLVKAILYGMGICIPVAILEMGMFHGVYDALALGGTVNPVVGGISFFILIYFCRQMHKEAKGKVIAMMEKDHQNV